MTTGRYTVGSSTQALFSTKNWTGADDPAHKAWNSYTMTAIRQIREPAIRRSATTGAYIDSPLYYGTTLWAPSQKLFDANDDLKLWAKVADQIRGHSFNAAVTGAELGQTLGMVTERAKSLFSAFRNVRKGNLSKALQVLNAGKPKKGFRSKDVSGLWLELQYGWKPLVSDVYSGMQFIEAQTAGPRSIEFEERVSKKISQEVSNSPPEYSIVAEGVVSRTYRVEYTEGLSTPRSLGLLNPAAVLWEKLPWSFVIDWFIPVGTYLDVIGSIPYVEGWLYRTDFSRASANYRGGYRVSGVYTYQGGGVNYSSVAVKRHAPTKIGSGLIKAPTLAALEKAFSIGHIKNAAALVWQGIASARHQPPFHPF